MGKDDLPAFPTPKETFGYQPPSGVSQINTGNIPPPPPSKYGAPRPPSRQNSAPPPPGHGGGDYYGHYQTPPPPHHHHHHQNPYQQPPYGGQPPPPPPPPPPQQPPYHQPPYSQPPYSQAPPPPPPPPPPQPQPPPPGPSARNPQYPPSFNSRKQQSPPGHHAVPAQNPYGGPPPAQRTSSPSTNLQALFKGVDRNGNGTLSENELGSALVNGDYTKFNRETVKLMIKMFDRNNDGAIDYEEFGNLWRYLRDWRKIFDKFDVDKSGSISYDEYVRALNAFGYSLSNATIQYMYNTYSHRDRWGERTISFDMFVQSCINLKRITDSFKKFDANREGYITVGFEQFLTEVLALR